MTVKQALEWGQEKLKEAGTHDPEGRTRFLLRHTLGENTDTVILTDPERTLDRKTLGRFRTMVDRRLRHEPVWYIANEAYFWRDCFYVDDRVLIPRPETELLVEEALRIINRESTTNTHSRIYANRSYSHQFVRNSRRLAVVDVGTGCGNIALSLARELGSRTKIYATDISADAIEVTKSNVKLLDINSVTFLTGDVLYPLPEPVDLIVGNPPYIPSDEIKSLAYDIHHFEPRVALDGGGDGLDVHRKILRQAAGGKLKSGGTIILEIGWNQGKKAKDIAKKYYQNAATRIIKDYQGFDRMLVVST